MVAVEPVTNETSFIYRADYIVCILLSSSSEHCQFKILGKVLQKLRCKGPHVKSLFAGVEVDQRFIEVKNEIVLVGRMGRGQKRRSGHLQYLPFQLFVHRSNIFQ